MTIVTAAPTIMLFRMGYGSLPPEWIQKEKLKPRALKRQRSSCRRSASYYSVLEEYAAIKLELRYHPKEPLGSADRQDKWRDDQPHAQRNLSQHRAFIEVTYFPPT